MGLAPLSLVETPKTALHRFYFAPGSNRFPYLFDFTPTLKRLIFSIAFIDFESSVFADWAKTMIFD
jgi:hypothetical protein